MNRSFLKSHNEVKIVSFTCCILLCTLACHNTLAQPINIDKHLYVAQSLPDSLKENANAVVRYAEETLVFKSPGNVVQKNYELVTILNEKGDHKAEFGATYQKKFNSIGNIWMKVYNADGVLIKKYSKGDMYDGSAIDDATLVTDDRILAIKHAVSSYPVTIETYFESNLSSLINPESWYLQTPETSIEFSKLNVSVNPAMGFRYKVLNAKLEPEVSAQDGMQNYIWTVKNSKAFKTETGAPYWTVAKKIRFATNQFQFFGLEGNMSSWSSFGRFMQGLNADVCTLPAARAAEIQAMTANCSTDKDKAKLLYQYLQHNTRYVSVQLGLGGFKPFSASFVDQKKYGDCKALSNYMYALLKAVNIPSYYAVVNSGINGEPADDKFTFDTFDHVILCVPFKNDTTWLECTSNIQQFGHLGSFTENRKALLITEEGGKLVNTPKSSIRNNTFDSSAEIVLDTLGGAKAKFEFKTTGGYREIYTSLNALKTEEKKEYLINDLNIKQPIAFNLTDKEEENGVNVLTGEVEYDKFSDVAVNDKFFYRPRVFDLWQLTLPEVEKRRSDYFFEYPMHKSCITTITLPTGFDVDNLPANVDLKFSFGSYTIKYVYDKDKNKVINTTVFDLTAQKIPAIKYPEMQAYMNAIAKAQSKKLVIHRKA